MKKLAMLLALAALTLGLAVPALAADEALSHSGRVLLVAGGDVTVAAGEQADAVIVLGGDATIAGTVNTLVVVDGTVTTTNATLETIVAVSGTAELGAGTNVLGDVMRFDSRVETANGVEIGGSIKDVAADVAAFGVFMGIAALAIWIGVGIATLVVGLLTAGLAARQVRMATTLISREPGTTFLVGLLGLIVPPVLSVLAIATIIGIPAGLGLLFVIWPAVAFVGYVVAAIWLGQFLLYRRADAVVPDRPYAAAVVGLLVAFVIGLVPLVTAVVSIFGLGAVVLAAVRTLRRDRTAQPAIQPQPMAAG